MTRYFVGLAWPYANGPFHIGHLAGAYLPGDVFARFHRLCGDEVLMVSGSDMHGTPILVRAEQEGTTPAEVAERFDTVNRQSFDRLGFSFDCFTSTRTLVHQRTVQELFLRLLENGYIQRKTEPNAYCPKHARFLPDRYLTGRCPHCGSENARGDECDNCGRALEPRSLIEPRCRLCGTPAERRDSEHFYLQLDQLADKLGPYVAAQSHWRASVAKIAANFLAEGLHPTPITRDLDWGVPIPLDGYDGKRFYVWFDALIGYLSASREWAIRSGRPEAVDRYWDPRERVRHYYFIGKDNTFHHTILWPGILLGVGDLPLPYDVPANEWLVLGGKKFAKSGSVGLDGSIPSLLERYTPDHIRFYAALLAPQNHDTEFDPEEFVRLYDEVLANQIGNLAQRTLVLARDRLGSQVPDPGDRAAIEGPGSVGARIREAHDRITASLEKVELKEALELALAEIRAENRRFHEAKPWDAPDAERARAVYESLWVLEAESIWLAPFLPAAAERLRTALGHPGGPDPGSWSSAPHPPEPGRPLGPAVPLFPRRDQPPATPGPARATGTTQGAASGNAPVRLDLRVAEIREAAVHPSADRLLALTVDAGEGRIRSVVAGLRAYYAPEQLRGRRVVLLTNLAPRTIRSIPSEGMVLAAEAGERVALLLPPSSASIGASVSPAPPGEPPISFDAFSGLTLRVGRVLPEPPEGRSAVDIGERSITVDGRWTPGSLIVVRIDPATPDQGTVLAFGEAAIGADPATGAGAKVR
jgi:methionyl-tRNA synthetase